MSSSSSTEYYLPLELWEAISARLPIKTLLRMRSVCKAWRSMIDSPSFTDMHYRIYNESNPSKAKLLLCAAESQNLYRYGSCKFTTRHSTTFRKVDEVCEISNLSKEIILLGSCNGLWLIEHDDGDDYRSVGRVAIRRVLNPFVRKSFRLPDDHIGLFTVNCVLGFAPSTNDYKVVRFMQDIRTSDFSISVCSLISGEGDHKWRTKSDKISVPIWNLSKRLRATDVLFIKNAGYWLNENASLLMWFDFDREELSFSALPDAAEDTQTLPSKFIFNFLDSIAVLSISYSSTRVWTFDKNSSSSSGGGGNNKDHRPWRLWLSTDTHPNAVKFLANLQILPKAILYQHATSTFFMPVRCPASRKLVSYNVSNHKVRYLSKQGFWSSVDNYVENLVSHNHPQWKRCDIFSPKKAKLLHSPLPYPYPYPFPFLFPSELISRAFRRKRRVL